MKTHSGNLSITTPAAFAAAILAMSAGCVYVNPARRNPVWTGAYTRAETLSAEQRLVDALLADPTFAQHYATKVESRGGAVPVVQVSHLDNLSAERHASLLGAVRRNLETALRSSGRFIISGDPAACDYLLRGEYRDVADGWRVTHQLALQLHDTASDIVVWTASDEIAKEIHCPHDVHERGRRPLRRCHYMSCRQWFYRRHCGK